MLGNMHSPTIITIVSFLYFFPSYNTDKTKISDVPRTNVLCKNPYPSISMRLEITNSIKINFNKGCSFIFFK
ncbi:hypothetical protein VIN01S_21230 [Vibrio inusitatus NBRC 102082]|uniref:Uncharacterized protein n=1 Tax=Vibrio inusitatus NBRC 102082 TaxID=1219070 RepID=A0A4Y3HVW5_9VIBR|nr:hypothetical protein VIN01S_21230 [Vibrio inusitatus NBRC 102082]